MGLGAFEPNYALRLFLAVWHRVRVVTDVDLWVVSKTLVAGSLIGNTSSTLEESCLASLSNWVDAELVEASRGGDGGVVVHPLPAVDGPVVVAVVVHGPVPVKHQPVLTNLLVQGAVGALVELVAVLLVGVQLEAVGLWAGRVLGRGTGCQAEQNESKCLHGHSAKSTGLHCTALHSPGRPAAVQCADTFSG